MNIYYAHCMSIYKTPQENRDMAALKTMFPNDKIYNPSEDVFAEQGYQLKGMEYFTELVSNCDVLVFRALPDGQIPAGVAKEIDAAVDNNLVIIELPSFYRRRLDVADTRAYLKEIGFR